MKFSFKKVALASAASLTVAMGAMAHADEVTVATDPSFVPFEMMDQETGEMVGFDMDIIREIGTRAGFTPNINTMDFNGIIPALQTGSVDIAIAGMTITD
jgi:glutamine transport system substrate-binding protein